MSTQPERKEKNCLNCGEGIHGRFCHRCGQENIIPHQNFWSLVRHFIYDIFHFDGKFFDTLRLLMFRPGFVAREYISGKRVRFLDPIRMYLFTSAIFFIIFFTLKGFEVDFNAQDSRLLDRAERMQLAMTLSQSGQLPVADSTRQKQLASLLDSTKQIELRAFRHKDSSSLVRFQGKPYNFIASTDTGAIAFTNDGSSNWITRKLENSVKSFKEKYKDDYDAGTRKIFSTFLHRLPYLLFLSLPFFAALLKLLYIRRRNFLYSDHAIFTLYHYIFSFILLLLIFLFNALQDWSGWGLFGWMTVALVIIWPVHLFAGLKSFYGNGVLKTSIKFLLLNILGFILLLALIILFFLFGLFALI